MMKRIKSVNSYNFQYNRSKHPPAPFKGGFKSVCVSLFLSLTVISCSQNNLSTASISSTEKVSIFKVSDNQGAEVNFKIASSSVPPLERGVGGMFSTKANTDGIAPKTAADVDHYVVYLIKDTTATGTYPLNGDPLNASNIVAGPFTITNDGSVLVKFTGVNPLATGAYYVAVRAQDNSNNDLIRANNGSATSWTGTTAGATYNSKVAVSSGNGVTVNNSYVVSTNTLSVTVNLPNATGARIDASITTNNGTISGTPSSNTSSISGFINTVAGGGTSTADGVLATNAQLSYSYGLGLDSSNNLYIADTTNNKIKKVNLSTGIITTIAGTGTGGSDGNNGLATDAQLNRPSSVVLDSKGNIYIADLFNDLIRKIDKSSGIITTFVSIRTPRQIAIDFADNLYSVNSDDNYIEKITPSGVITTIAGTGVAGSTGDNGQATSAQLNGPFGIATDMSGNLYISDSSNNKIRKVTASTGIITTIAGTGVAGSTGDNGQATSAQLNNPRGLSLDSAGNIYFAEYDSNKIRKINTAGIITTIAGTVIRGYNGDNIQATTSQLSDPYSAMSDHLGNVYVADTSNQRIRKIYK